MQVRPFKEKKGKKKKKGRKGEEEEEAAAAEAEAAVDGVKAEGEEGVTGEYPTNIGVARGTHTLGGDTSGS